MSPLHLATIISITLMVVYVIIGHENKIHRCIKFEKTLTDMWVANRDILPDLIFNLPRKQMVLQYI